MGTTVVTTLTFDLQIFALSLFSYLICAPLWMCWRREEKENITYLTLNIRENRALLEIRPTPPSGQWRQYKLNSARVIVKKELIRFSLD